MLKKDEKTLQVLPRPLTVSLGTIPKRGAVWMSVTGMEATIDGMLTPEEARHLAEQLVYCANVAEQNPS